MSSTISPHNNDDDSNPILNRLRKVYNTGLFHDLILLVNGKRHNAHRFLLRVCSSVFEELLENSVGSAMHPEIVGLIENPMCVEAFPMFLQYFYTGAMTVKETKYAMPVLMLAKKYKVKHLKELCIEFMCANIVNAADQGYLIMWFQYGLSLNRPPTADAAYYFEIWDYDTCRMDIKPRWYNLLKICKNFIKWNLELCAQCFNTFECDVLVGLLKQTDLVVHDEMKLFGYVTSWLNNKSAEKLLECNNADIVKDYMSSLTKNVMSYIRYPMMLSRQMAQLRNTSIFKENTDFFVAKLDAAMNYHTVQMENVISADHTLECTPRLYTSKLWGDSFKMNFQVLQSVERDIVTRSRQFDIEDQEHEKTNWKVEIEQYYDMRQPPAILNKTVKVNIAQKILQESRNNAHNVRVTILVHTFQKKCGSESAHVTSLLEQVGYFDNPDCGITFQIVCGAIISLDETSMTDWLDDQIPFKFHVIITPIIPGLTDCDGNDNITRNKHVFGRFVF